LEKDKGRKVENKMAALVTGFTYLPEEGGILDQGVWTMSMFDAFRSGENTAAMKRLK